MKSVFTLSFILCVQSLLIGQDTEPISHENPMMAYMDHLESAVLVGEQTEKYDFNRTWLWKDGWTLVKTENSPPRTIGHAMAYDSERGLLVLFGGRKDREWLDDTWVFDGKDWRNLNIPGPPGRTWHRMVYDEANDRIVLMGGAPSLYGAFGDTWVFDGQKWKELESRIVPVRLRHTMAYDKKNKRVVLHGGRFGYADSKQVLNDTWVLEGNEWKKLNVEPPLQRESHAMVYDEKKGFLMIYGGKNNIALRDCWILTDDKWLLSDNTGPRRTGRPAFIYDSKKALMYLFGGVKPGKGRTNELWSYEFRNWKQLTGNDQ